MGGVVARAGKPSLSMRFAVLGVAVALAIAACQSTKVASTTPQKTPPGSSKPGTPAKPPTTPPATSQTPTTFSFKSSGNADFDKWRNAFAQKAAAAGRKKDVIVSVLDGLTPVEINVQVASFDQQAEFVKPIWDYAKSAVSPTRITNGQKKMGDNAAALTQIEQTYATPKEIISAIWGMESSYGSYIGDYDAARVLASQAYIGRRQAFNEGELMAIMQVIENGSATRDNFKKASWAGAIGQVQFMPSTYLSNARDFDKDGKKDIWNNAGDALASAANYMSNLGWHKGEPWAVEAAIPNGFDYSLGDGRKQPVGQWKSLGISPANGASFGSDSLQAELFLPAGQYGPAFLLYDNFNIIKKYNNADSYALAVGLLADRLAGRPDLAKPWPTNITMLTQDQAKQLQAALNKLGYNVGTADGIIGRNTRKGLQSFQKDRGIIADGFPTSDMFDKVMAAAA